MPVSIRRQTAQARAPRSSDLPPRDDNYGLETLVPGMLVVPVLEEKSWREEHKCSSVFAMTANHVPKKLHCSGHPVTGALTLTNFKAQGGTFEKLIMSVHSRPFPPHIDLEALYVFISRVTKLDNLRVLCKPADGFQNLLDLKHAPEMRVWAKGYDECGDWSIARARAAAAVERERAKAAPPKKRKQKAPSYWRTDEGKARVASRLGTGALVGTKCAAPKAPTTTSSAKKPSNATTAQQQFLQQQLQSNRAHVHSMGLPALEQPRGAVLPSWWTAAQAQFRLRARVVDFWRAGNDASQLVCDYLHELGFATQLDSSRAQETNACAFVAARVVNDLHAADDWTTCAVNRAADHEWVVHGNTLLGRTGPRQMHNGFMASGDQVEQLVRGFWQQDVHGTEHEQGTDIGAWLPLPCATALDAFMVELANDLHAAAISGTPLPLRLRITNTQSSTGRGMHWFTVAYSMEYWTSVPPRRALTTVPGKRQALEAAVLADISMEASETSDDDSMDDFISNDGGDWRKQVDWQQAGRKGKVAGVDLHRARIDAGFDPGASADDETEDDVDMRDLPVRRCRFLDDEAGEAGEADEASD